MQRRCGEHATDLVTIDAYRVLRTALERVLADLQEQGIRTAADCRIPWRRNDAAIGEGEVQRPRGQQRRRSVRHRGAVVGDAVDVQVAIGVGRAVIKVVKEVDGQPMWPGR
jgi:hypothetical protein